MQQYLREIAELAYQVHPDPLLLDEGMYDASLTGKELHLTAIEMCYLALEVMSHYQIRLLAQDVEDSRFCSVRSIAECVAGKLKTGEI